MKETKKARGTQEEAAFLDLLRTCDLLSRGPAQFLKSEDLSPTQYNVLRILRGAPPAGLPCGEIANRMVTPRINPQGLKLLARLDEPVQEMHRKQLGHLGGARLKELQDLLGAARVRVI